VLGEGVLIYERAKVGVGFGDAGSGEDSRRSSVSSSVSARDSMRVDGTVLGKNVVIDSAAIVEAAEIGEGTVVEAQAVLGRGCIVGKVSKQDIMQAFLRANRVDAVLHYWRLKRSATQYQYPGLYGRVCWE
jgi:carbonic anhydrase/acetyltransferase-like protein (isoleucine patch superfamily)